MKRLLLITLLLLSAATAISAQSYLRQGESRFGKVLCNWDGTNLHQGDSHYGTVLINFDGQYIRQGDSRFGTVVWNIEGSIPIAIIIFLLMN